MSSTEPTICVWQGLLLTATRVFEHAPPGSRTTYRSIPLRQIDCLSLEYTENGPALWYAVVLALAGVAFLMVGVPADSVFLAWIRMILLPVAVVVYIYFLKSRSTTVTINAGQAAIQRALTVRTSKDAIEFLEKVQCAIDAGSALAAKSAAG